MNNVIVWRFHWVVFTQPFLLSLGVSVCLVALALVLHHRIAQTPDALPVIGEATYQLMHDAVSDVVGPTYVERVLPFVGTLWLFILLANLLGLVPGLASPTRDLSVTSALAVIVFAAVHVFGVRACGWNAYLRHYLSPNPFLLPFHLISEITRTIALAIRLFGNMMSLEMAAMLVLLVAGLLVPVPLLLLHVVEAIVQAYIFGMLALIYIGSALETGQQGQPPPTLSPS